MAPVLCPILVGRDKEIGLVDDYLARLSSEHGGVLFISGEAGIGKSRLLRAVVERAREHNFRVMTGRAPQSGAGVPFHPLGEAFQTSITESELGHPSLEMYRAALSALMGLEQTPGTPEPSLLASMEALLRAFRVMASERPVLLLLEDIHAADPETLAVVEYISDRLQTEPIGCIATERSDAGLEASSLVSTLVARRSAERIVLNPLSVEQVDEMARQALDVDVVPQGLLDALNLRVEGVPFLVEEMLGAYVAAGGSIERQPEGWVSRHIAKAVPHSYREVVRARLTSLDPSSRSVVFAAAMLGRAFDWKVLAAVTDQTNEQVLDALRAAVAVNLLTSGGDHFATVFGFRHALAREAVGAELLEPERAELSLRTARAIEAVHPHVPGELCNRAALLYEEGGQPLEAVRLLQEKARRALARSALESAEAALIHASDLAPDDWMVWMGTDDLLLDVYSLAGKHEELLERGRLLIAGFERYEGHVMAPRQSSFHLKIARALLLGGDSESCATHLDNARRLAAEMNDESVESQIAAVRGESALSNNDLKAARSYAELALETAARFDLTATRCEALDMLARIALARGTLKEATEAASQLITLADDPKLVVWKIRALLHQGSVDAAVGGDVARLDLARSLAISVGAVSVLAAIELQIAWAHLGRGSIHEADPHIDRSVEISRLHSLGTLWEALSARCMALGLAGDAEGVEGAEIEATSVARDPRATATIHANGRAVLAIASGDDNSALGRLDEALTMAPEETPDWWRGLHKLLDVALRDGSLGDDARAPSTATDHPMNAAYGAYAKAILLGREGETEAARLAFERAEDTVAPGWRRHHARRVMADAALDGEWGDPVAWASEALEYFDDLSFKGLVTTCRSTLRRAGAPVRRRGRGDSIVPDDLKKLGITSREMDVLKLVAERLSNREIGARLFLSPRTVESHVSSLQRKTGTGTRGELVELGRQHPP
jgi:DNA-binding CsgD family transcriptional regulator